MTQALGKSSQKHESVLTRLAADVLASQQKQDRAPGTGDGVVIDLRREEPSVEVRPDPQHIHVEGRGLLASTKRAQALKRTIDFSVALICIVVLSPLMLAAAVAVKLTSRGPVLFIDRRTGRGGKTFSFAKFRSMCDGANDMLHDLKHENEADGPVFKMREDPRVTKVGKFMRKYSIDELPQLFHVLTGQMSLVGPRPPLPSEVVDYEEWQLQRLLVKPGITCLWQVNGRSDVDFEAWCELDLKYIAEWSLGLDVKLMLKTIPAVLSGKGAY